IVRRRAHARRLRSPPRQPRWARCGAAARGPRTPARRRGGFRGRAAGDARELVPRPPRRTMVMAEPVLRALAKGLGPEREIIVVPGNHDAPLLRHWALAQCDALDPSHSVPPPESP